MSRIFISGCGAVSPAGWGVAPLIEALQNQTDLPTQNLSNFKIRAVPPPATRPAIFTHARLRRASAISQFATAAAHEALDGLRQPNDRLGIVVGVHAASIRYSDRFYSEVIKDPATASPLLFPETVINAPASHLAATLGAQHLAYSVLGDQTAFLQALAIAATWLTTNRADLVLVISSEETDWTVSTAANYFSDQIICAEGAGAICLSLEGRAPRVANIELTHITDPFPYASNTREQAAQKMSAQLEKTAPSDNSNTLLCDTRTGLPRWDQPETKAWQTWRGPTLSPRKTLGEALAAATAWQFIAAIHRLQSGSSKDALISAVGSNHQSLGARLSISHQ